MTSPDKQPDAQGDTPSVSSWHQPPPQHYSPNKSASSASPLPPGFPGGNGLLDAAAAGQRLRESSGVLSAPPPPGFKPDSPGDRSRYASEMLSSDHVTGSGGTEHGLRENNHQQASTLQSGPHNQSFNQNRGTLSEELAQTDSGRTSSFVNLAAMLGTGLVESMDNATRGEIGKQLQSRSFDKDSTTDLNLARQSRHTAARLMGASPPHVGLNFGAANFSSAAPPEKLGEIYSSTAQGYQRSLSAQNGNGKQNGFNGEGYLTSNFSSQDAGNAGEDIFGSNLKRHGFLSSPRDIGLTVMEPGSDQRPDDRLGGITPNRPYYDDAGGALGALMQQHQKGYLCDDPLCHDTTNDPFCNDPLCTEPKQQICYDADCPDRDTFAAESAMRNLFLEDSASVGQASRDSRSRQRHMQQPQYLERTIENSSVRSGGSQVSTRRAESELRPFIWDTRQPRQQNPYMQQQQQEPKVEPSRCLAILRAAHLQVPEVRSTCEAFGVIDTFRSDFADRGIIFVSYYDIRSAQYAALELESVLNRRGGSMAVQQDVRVFYCVPLNSSTQMDDRLIISDVPQYVDEHSLFNMLSSYGAVRSLKRQGGYYGGASFEAEFHNVQDSKQALMELTSTQPWGPDVAIEVGMRPAIDRKRGRELLATIGRWRQSNTSPSSSVAGRNFETTSRLGHGGETMYGPGSVSSDPAMVPHRETTQMVLGPDGRYSYAVSNNQSGYQGEYNPVQRRHQHQERLSEQPRQQIMHGPNGEIYITTILPAQQQPHSYRQGGGGGSRDFWPHTSQPPQHHVLSQYGNVMYADGRDRSSGGYYPNHVPGRQDPHGMQLHHHHHPHSSNASTTSAGDDRDNKNLVLDLDAVEQGRDARTSLMVRNIPNKYTQQMLLSEFTENGLGPGVIDFFYLPIDFKNRCNRGYAFINFVDFKDILPFHRRYFGKHWSTFNSDKICDITYARIQGKAAMLKRFENSALMEKDEEYKPLVFISHGPEKGKRIPFPEAAAGVSMNKA